jgi:hypothetical protein
VSWTPEHVPVEQEDCGGEVELKDPEAENPVRMSPEFENDRVNRQDGSITTERGLPSLGKVDGLEEHPLTVTFALGAELIMAMEIG